MCLVGNIQTNEVMFSCIFVHSRLHSFNRQYTVVYIVYIFMQLNLHIRYGRLKVDRESINHKIISTSTEILNNTGNM